jgi:hypothetical protein
MALRARLFEARMSCVERGIILLLHGDELWRSSEYRSVCFTPIPLHILIHRLALSLQATGSCGKQCTMENSGQLDLHEYKHMISRYFLFPKTWRHFRIKYCDD